MLLRVDLDQTCARPGPGKVNQTCVQALVLGRIGLGVGLLRRLEVFRPFKVIAMLAGIFLLALADDTEEVLKSRAQLSVSEE